MNRSSLSLCRTYNRRRRIGGQHSGCHDGRELCRCSPQEWLRHIPDNTRWGWGKNYHHQHRTRRRWTRTEKTQEGFAGNRPLHYLWQQNWLSRLNTTSQHPDKAAMFRDQTRVLQTGFSTADPWNIYLFISDATSHGVKLLLKRLRGSDASVWSCQWPRQTRVASAMVEEHWHWRLQLQWSKS